MPYISPPHQLSKNPFSQGRFGLHSEPKFRTMEAQYLQPEVRWTPTPKDIFVPHIIPNNSAQYCSTQLCLYEKLWLGHKTTALPPERGGVRRLMVTNRTKTFGHDCTRAFVLKFFMIKNKFRNVFLLFRPNYSNGIIRNNSNYSQPKVMRDRMTTYAQGKTLGPTSELFPKLIIPSE